MAEFEGGLPSEEIDPSEGAISGFSYIDNDYKQEDIEEQEIRGMSFSDVNYVREDIEEQEILGMSFSVDETERMNYMSMT